jgi:hypothetical protein
MMRPSACFEVQSKMDGKIFDSKGHYVADILASKMYDRSARGRTTSGAKRFKSQRGELTGQLSSIAGDRRPEKSADRLFPNYSPAGLSSWGLKAKPK